MRTVNKVILIGNVTRDALVKETEGGKKIAMFSLATNRYYKTLDGQNKSEVEFHNCVAWGPLAEKAEQYITKGKLLYVEGRLKTRVLDKEGGDKFYKTEVVIGNMIFLNKRSDFEDAGISDDFSDNDDMF